MTTVGQSVLILAQEGAELAPYVATFQREEAASVEVLQQAPGESMSAFKQRLTSRLASIAGAGGAFEHGAFVAKSGFGLADVLATVALLSCLVTAMVALGTGHVYLCGHAGDAQAGYALEALADAMRDQVRGTGVEVVTDDRLGVAPDHESALADEGQAVPAVASEVAAGAVEVPALLQPA